MYRASVGRRVSAVGSLRLVGKKSGCAEHGISLAPPPGEASELIPAVQCRARPATDRQRLPNGTGTESGDVGSSDIT